MKLNVSAELAYDVAPETEVILLIQAAASADQRVLHEQLIFNPPVDFFQDQPDAEGVRRVRATLSGHVTIRYEALVDNGFRTGLPAGARQLDWGELPPDVLRFLQPSRYCPSDKLALFATEQFGALHDGGARVLAVIDWINANITYQAGVSTATTDAEQTLNDRAGVCRDFSHLGITFCRALGIPARAVSAYAHQLEPQDFHAIFEVYLAGGWWLVDATKMSNAEGLVRIAVGRDAADIAFLTTSLPCDTGNVSVKVSLANKAAAA